MHNLRQPHRSWCVAAATGSWEWNHWRQVDTNIWWLNMNSAVKTCYGKAFLKVPVLFIIYTTQLSQIIDEFGINWSHFADDTQFDLNVDTDEASVKRVGERLEECCRCIESWMTSNKLNGKCFEGEELSTVNINNNSNNDNNMRFVRL